MNIYEILGAKREEILQVAAKYGAYNIRIFGSVAVVKLMLTAMLIF